MRHSEKTPKIKHFSHFSTEPTVSFATMAVACSNDPQNDNFDKDFVSKNFENQEKTINSPKIHTKDTKMLKLTIKKV